ncbi:MAG: hypothetical protein IK010_03200 [Bacteroidales bacterium]|nr:hypothetical protein [Bacteroidales bacterium]
MKTRLFAIVAAALMLTACRFNLNLDNLSLDYADTADVRDEMLQGGYDAALMTMVGDTQRVTYLRLGSDTVLCNSAYFSTKTDHSLYGFSKRMYLTMSQSDGNAVKLKAINDTVLQVDSNTTLLLVRPMTVGDEVRRFVAWSLNGIQEAIDSTDAVINFSTVDSSVAEINRAVVEVGRTIAEFDTVIVSPGCDAQKSFERLEKKGKELHYSAFEIRHHAGHRGCTFSCSHALPAKAKKCERRMSQLSALADQEGLEWEVTHDDAVHVSCTFEAHN